jgi:tetratricopeptide (TPR) repeat protein
MPKERLIPVLTDIAKSFAANAGVQGDLAYAEKIFKKIEEIGTKEAFNEELLYVRAFNLEKFGEYLQARDIYIDLVTLYPKSIHADEADFKIGIIYTYIARDLKNGKVYFERLAQKELVSPQVIAGLYQLGLLSQWGQDLTKAKEYYLKLIEKAKNEYPETVGFANERLKEIKESRPIEYNLKVFLDVSLKEEYLALDTTKLDLKAQPLTVKKDEGINFVSRPYIAASGCLHVELQYLWSGDTGKVKPSLAEPAFDTAYTENGTKVVSLVVVSPSGIVDRNIYMTDVISDIPAKN